MRTVEIVVYNYKELSSVSRMTANTCVDQLVNDIIGFHHKDIDESYEAVRKHVEAGTLDTLNADDCALTGICYDFDFIKSAQGLNRDDQFHAIRHTRSKLNVQKHSITGQLKALRISVKLMV